MLKRKILLSTIFFLWSIFLFSQAQANSDYSTIKLNDISITVINDNANNFSAELFPTLDKYPDSKKLMHNGAFTGIVRTFLFKLGDKLILVDGGWGIEGRRHGKTVEILKSLGYNTSDITDILLTHLDVDHVSGLIDKGERVYPNATLWLNQKQYSAWTEGEPRDKHSVENARNVLKVYKGAGKISFYKWGAEVFPQIKAIQADGHTPGHTVFCLTNGKNKLYFLGDLLHAGDLQLAHPECSSKYDADPERAALMRREILQHCADEKSIVAGAHFIKIGVVKRSGSGFIVE